MSQASLTSIISGMPRIPSILKKIAGPTPSVPDDAHVTIRHARPADHEALALLARLDSSQSPRGDVLVAEVSGELWAAVSLDDHQVVADPFRPSSELAFRLLGRAREVRRAEPRPPGRGTMLSAARGCA
jgi:hypothetical protein